MTEKTKTQTTVSGVFISHEQQEELTRAVVHTYAKRRNVRKDPSIALGRSFSVAPILTSPWSVQADEDVSDEVVKFIKEQIEPWRLTYLIHSLFSGIDFGWAPFEVVYGEKNGKIVLEKLKPLLQDITTILVDGKTGAFSGFKQDIDIIVSGEKALLVSFRVEGTMWHGQALLDSVIGAYDSWNDANNGAKRYDKKMAGSHFAVYYPPGSCLDSDGNTVTNDTMAQTLLDALESSGSVAVPNTILEHIEDLSKNVAELYAWRIVVLEDRGGRQPSFIQRLRYLDVLKIRGMIMPERSMVEGTHGTLAEASAHMDLALTYMDFTQLYVLTILNQRVVNVLLKQNWGEGMVGKVWYIPTSLVDTKRVYLEKVYLMLVSKMASLEGIEGIDLDSLKDLVGVPKTSKVTKNPEGKKTGEEDEETDEKV